MQAGENTLNAVCARLVTRGIAARGAYSPAGFLEDCEWRGAAPSGVGAHQQLRRPASGYLPACLRSPACHLALAASHPPTLHADVSFMTTPGSHNDTYAESFHRDFFR